MRSKNWYCSWPGELQLGYRRIAGALNNLDTRSAPDRGESSETARHRTRARAWPNDELAGVIRSHMEVLAAVDFFTVEVWTRVVDDLLRADVHASGNPEGVYRRNHDVADGDGWSRWHGT